MGYRGNIIGAGLCLFTMAGGWAHAQDLPPPAAPLVIPTPAPSPNPFPQFTVNPVDSRGGSLKKFTWPADQIPTIDDADQGDWEGGSRAGLKQALTEQIRICKTGNQNELSTFAGEKIPRSRWCTATVAWFLAKVDQVKSLSELHGLAARELDWFQSTGKPANGEVQFTGYYYPVLEVRSKADEVYKYPIYRTPPDLVQIVVDGKRVWRKKTASGYALYPTRAEIVAGALNGMGAEIAYASNPIDPFFLQIQGSGALVIDGSKVRQIVNYASENGRGYTSIGKVMREHGIDEKYLSLQGMKKYFTEVHPEEWEFYSNHNQSYVFFREDTTGPYGSNGAIITPKHSIAIDPAAFPLGLVGLIQTARPSVVVGDQATAWKAFSQIIVAQDTGGAIKTPGRVDIFWGEGNYAAVAGGQTNQLGNLFFAVMKANPASSAEQITRK